ncbi:MAG: Ig-like domain-containing protein [Actinobacteria bacterium]|nr:Ig-like domain-containing protein [Actinomycetota bacterium]
MSDLSASGGEPAAPNGTKPTRTEVSEPTAPNGTKPAEANGSQPPGGGVVKAPATTPDSSGGKPFKPDAKLIALGTATAVAITAGIVFAVTQPTTNPGPGASHGAAGPVRVVSVSPSSQSTGVNGAGPIIVTFSKDVSAKSPKPKLSPGVPGTWTAEGNSLIFLPARAFQPSTTVTIRVPSGRSGVHSAGGGLLTSAVTSRFTTGGYSQSGLAVLLAQQGYLPLTWGPAAIGAGVDTQSGSTPAAETPQGIAYSPPAGTFSWEPGYPATLRDQWSADQPNVLLTGAVMAFESQHNLPPDGKLTPKLWSALFDAQARGQRNANGYTYAIATKGSPEMLTIWHNGEVVQRSLANTGIAVAPTVDGTFPVFERFRFQIMSGTNPDGSHYADPVQYVAYFNGGDAVHYFPRGSYGSPQSLGCVELNMTDAQHAWPFLTYGSLVSVVS